MVSSLKAVGLDQGYGRKVSVNVLGERGRETASFELAQRDQADPVTLAQF